MAAHPRTFVKRRELLASNKKQVRRNRERFPADFLFELTAAEFSALMLQNASSKPGRGGRRKLPFAFTEHRLRGLLPGDRDSTGQRARHRWQSRGRFRVRSQ
jgi:ORF6N domain